MLSIGRLAPGTEHYYLRSIAAGVEDYYLGAGEAPGRWGGRLAEDLGLAGEVDAESLQAVLGGFDPHGGDSLFPERPGRRQPTRPGFDVTVSTPKSVSLLYAFGGPTVQAEVVAAHEAAAVLNNQRGQTGSPQIITLSAVVGDMRGLERWLGGRRLHSDARPVPLVEGVLDHHGIYRFLDEDGQEQAEPGFVQPLYDIGSRRLLIPLVRRLMDEDKKVVVFRQSKPEAVACAVYLSQALGLPAAEQALGQLGQGDISTSTQTLQRTLGGGVAFHNTDLDRDERRVVEETFRDPASTVRVVVATPTLAMGINTPAARWRLSD